MPPHDRRYPPTIRSVHPTAVLASHEWAPPDPADGATAPVVVLVHGITGWWRTWWRVAPALAERGWRAVAVDLRGHGTSPPIDGAATAESLAADVEATIASLDVTAVGAFVAHSLGAVVVMELAYRRPELVGRLVLEDPPGQTRADDHDFQAHLEREVLAARRDPEAEVRRELAENPAWQPEDARQNVEGRALCDLEGILASLRGNTGVRPTELAPQLQVPALYLVADPERSALGDRRDKLLGSLPPGAEAVEFEAGHTIHRDRFDAYVGEVLRWLDR